VIPPGGFGAIQHVNKDTTPTSEKVPAKKPRKQAVPKVTKVEVDWLGNPNNPAKKRKRPQTYQDDSDYEGTNDGQFGNSQSRMVS
jgi:hypothetical protein